MANIKFLLIVLIGAVAIAYFTLFPSNQGAEFVFLSPKGAQIKLYNLREGQTIKSPYVLTGEAKGGWYFEASFPVKLLDANNKVLATGIAQAKGEWMTSNFVPFEAPLQFPVPSTATGKIILEKDNASGLPEHDDSITVPVKFRK